MVRDLQDRSAPVLPHPVAGVESAGLITIAKRGRRTTPQELVARRNLVVWGH